MPKKKLLLLAVLLGILLGILLLLGTKESQERQAFRAENPQRYEELLGILLEAEEKILKNPQNQDAWVNKGWVHEEFGEYEPALKAYKKALDIDEVSQIAWINMAAIYKKQGRYDLAKRAYENFIRIFPLSTQGYSNLEELQ